MTQTPLSKQCLTFDQRKLMYSKHNPYLNRYRKKELTLSLKSCKSHIYLYLVRKLCQSLRIQVRSANLPSLDIMSPDPDPEPDPAFLKKVDSSDQDFSIKSTLFINLP